VLVPAQKIVGKVLGRKEEVPALTHESCAAVCKDKLEYFSGGKHHPVFCSSYLSTTGASWIQTNAG
jgi:hypothetical protein